MFKNALYVLSVLLSLVAIYLIYQSYVAEPTNREPLPALISALSTIIVTVIAWRLEGNEQDTIKVKNIDDSKVDIDPKEKTNISVKKVKGKSTILINKGKDSLKNN